MIQYGLVDCNNFYVSCERLFAPALRNVPVVVLSNNDGCVISRSNEAKILGVPMTAPEFKWRPFFKAHNVKVLSSNYELYGDLSNRVYQALQEFSPSIEKYSIDESFLHLPDSVDGHALKETIYRHIGIPVSVGVGPTKTLAKVANHLAKNKPAYSGICYWPSGNIQDDILQTIPIQKLWGIGSGWARTLDHHGISSAFDLKHTGDGWIKQHMNVTGLRIVHELRGIPCLSLEEVVSERKHSICTQSFGHTVTSINYLREAVSSFASTAAARLRRNRQVASLVHVFIRTNRFGSGPSFHASYDISLPEPTSSGPAIAKAAIQCLNKMYKQGYRYKKAGVVLSGLEHQHVIQTHLFDQRDRQKDTALMTAFDTINNRYGKGSVKIGSEGLDQSWAMKRDFKSPRYTTQISELKDVH